MTTVQVDAMARGRCVAHFVHRWLGLTENWIYTQVRNTRTWTPLVLCWQANGNFIDVPLVSCAESPFGVRIFDRMIRLLGMRASRGFFARHLRNCGACVLHSHYAHNGWLMMDTALSLGIAHVVSVYGADVSRLIIRNPEWAVRYARLFSTAQAVVCEGNAMAGRLQSLGCSAEKIEIIPLAVDMESLPFKARERRLDDIMRILIVGTFREKKGIPLAIRAIGRARQLDPKLKVAVSIIGDCAHPEDVVEKDRIIAATQRWDLAGATKFLGWQTPGELRAAYYRHDVLLSPSITAIDGDVEGGAPVTLVEASATGMPIVATWHCDIPGIVRDGQTGLLAPEHDVDKLAANLLRLGRSPSLSLRLGREAAAHVRRVHAISPMIACMENLYARVSEADR